MRRIAAIFIGLWILFACALTGAHSGTNKIAILMWHEAPHDEQALQGFIEGIQLSGIAYKLDLKRAYGDEGKAREFIRAWKEEKVDLICTIGTKGTLWTMEEIKDIPIVFSAVTDPVATGIAKSWQSSGRNITGSSNWINLKTKLKIFKEAIPHLQTLGVIYRSNNPVPLAEVRCNDNCLVDLGITLKMVAIDSSDQIENAVKQLLDQGIDALWVPIEDEVYKNMSQVGKVTHPARLPVVSSTFEGVEDPAEGDPVGIVSLTVDYESLGRLCVPAAIEILTKGKDPKEIPLVTSDRYYITINVNAAEAIGYRLPPMLLAKADKVLRGFTGQRIVASGTGDTQALLREAAQTLEEQLGGGKIDIPESIGSGGGVRAAAAGEIDLGRVARQLTESEEKLGLTYKLFAKCPVVFVVHPSVTHLDNITSEEIVGIYSGKITDWSQLGGETGKIYAVGREPGDSCLIVLNKLIPGFKNITNPTSKMIYNTPDAVKTLIKHHKTIGYLPMSMAVGTDLRIMKVDGIYPSAENVSNGTYKLVVPFALVYRKNLEGLAKRFVDFLDSDEGKRIISTYGVVPE
ncbi:MAG: substrate-binding domain-containing protein [Desulfobulbaceae bacterium]|nr:substrate-binding domain-containing protein [Desulfobulbaceae bacterium]